MPVAVPDKRVYLPPHLTDMSEDGFIKRLIWQKHAGLLNGVVGEIRQGVVTQSKYSGKNVPDESRAEYPKVGKIKAKITTSPQGVRIPWGSVLDRFDDYVRFLWERYKAGVKEVGVVTIGNMPYVSTSHLRRKISEYGADERDKALKKLEATGGGIIQNVSIISPEGLLTEIPNELVVSFRGRNYYAFTESNLRIFQLAKNMLAEGGRRTVGYDEKTHRGGKVVKRYIKRFMELLLDDTLAQLGLKSGEVPEETPEPFSYPFESGNAYLHKIERRVRPAYSEILDKFVKEFPGVVKKNSTFGDFSALEMMQKDPKLEETLREKGLIDDEFVEDYGARRRGDHVMLRLGEVVEGRKPVGVIKRIGKYREDKEHPYIEQNLELDHESLLILK